MMTAIREQTLHLAPGEFAIGCKEDRQLVTVLGSCVALLLWHPQSRFYACCHYVCVSNSQQKSWRLQPDGRYADQILPYFVRVLAQRKIPLHELQVRLFGGASSAKARGLMPSFQVGQLNRDYALAFCQQHGLQPEPHYFGEEQGIRLQFATATGQVQVSRLTGSIE